MSASQTPFLYEIETGVGGPQIPAPTRAYFQQRLRQRVFAFLLGKFQKAQERGLTKAELARRIEKTPDVINRWLGTPSNLQLDTIADVLIGISGEEVSITASSIRRQPHNYSHFHDLVSSSGSDIYSTSDQKAKVTTGGERNTTDKMRYSLEGV